MLIKDINPRLLVTRWYHPRSQKVCLWADCYGRTLKYINALVNELRLVVPDAEDQDISVSVMDTPSTKGIICVESRCSTKPEGFTEIENLPNVFS